MPIYKQSYRSYSGETRKHFRWAVIIEQELRLAIKYKLLQYLLVVGMIHFILRLLQIVAYDIIMQDPNNPMTQVLLQADFIVVNARTFFDFIQMQAPLVLLAMLVIGSRMVCNDFKNNLMEVYFAKPLNWIDYVSGKVGALVLIGLLFTAIPAIILVLIHNLILPGWNTFHETWTFPFAILGFSLLITFPAALSILAASSLLKSESFSAAAIFILIIANSFFAGTLASMLRDSSYMIISTPMAMYELGIELFKLNQNRVVFNSINAGWQLPLLNVALVTIIAGAIFTLRVRKSEVSP